MILYPNTLAATGIFEPVRSPQASTVASFERTLEPSFSRLSLYFSLRGPAQHLHGEREGRVLT